MQTGGAQSPSAKLRGRIGRGDGFVALRLDGIIDEHNGLDHWVGAVGEGQTLLVDLGGVKRLNSVGVRDWVLWLRALRPRWGSIVLFDCPPPVMNEVNFVKNFAEGAIITTFQVPLFCTQCNKEDNRLVDAVELKQRGGALPSFRCERSDCANALDDDEESYLAFLAELPMLPEPERISRLTVLARDVLKPESPSSAPLDAAGNASATRAVALSQLGMAGHPAQKPASLAMPAAALGTLGPGKSPGAGAPAVTAGSPEAIAAASEAKRNGVDWVFIGAITAMVGVLGVLIYLLMTLE